MKFAVPILEQTFSLRVQRLLGDNFIFVIAAPGIDPGSLPIGWVGCKRHKTHKEIKFTGDVPTDDELLSAAQSCEVCIAEIEATLPPTRWPEGAEL